MKKRVFVLGLIGALILIFVTGCTQANEKNTIENPKQEVTYKQLMNNWKELSKEESLTCWYTDSSDEKWLQRMSRSFQEEYGKQVNLVYYDGNSIYEDMNIANQNGNGPDVYLCGNDQIELVRNTGLASENVFFDDKFWDDYFPQVTKKALTFKNKQYGFPLYFDTYCLVYDSKIMDTAPASMEDILLFSDDYSDTGATKAILRWDVADPYINTMFLAAYADLFGENGDDATSFQVYNDKTVETMTYFNSISEYMWMDKNNISHEIVKNRIKEGTLVLGLCKSDILPVLSEANKNDEVEYRISYMPSLTSKLASKSFSTTYIAMVNPYTQDDNLANMFACFLSCGNPSLMYEGNGKIPAVKQEEGLDENQSVVYSQYMNSCPVPKVLVFGDYISESAITFDAIWDGENVEEQLKLLQNKMDEKIN